MRLTHGLSFTDDDFDQFDKPGAERSWRRRAADEDWDRCGPPWLRAGPMLAHLLLSLGRTELFHENAVSVVDALS